jgi:hypothetical protein
LLTGGCSGRSVVPGGVRREAPREGGSIGDIFDLYVNPPIPLDHRDPHTLVVAVALSAQTTDKKATSPEGGACSAEFGHT